MEKLICMKSGCEEIAEHGFDYVTCSAHYIICGVNGCPEKLDLASPDGNLCITHNNAAKKKLA